MARYDPLAPLRPRQQRRQARQYVNAQIMPLLAQLNREFARRSASGEAAIGGYTNELARQLAPLAGQTHGIYAGAQQQQQGVDTALANRLTGAGASLGTELSAKLAQAGLAPANTAAATGAGAAAAGSGIGSAGLAALIARGAAAENYSAQLPGIARLGGLQRAKQYGAQLESERATQAGDLRAKIPGLTQQILADQQNREFQKAAARLSYGGDIYAANLSYKARSQSTNASYKARMAAIKAANTRSGMTLKERAAYHDRSLSQQAKADQERARQNRIRNKQARRRQQYRETVGNRKKKGGGGPPSLNK